MIKVDSFIGSRFPTPKGGVLTVVGVSDQKIGTNKVYQLTCSVCHEDKELFPDLFESLKGNLVNGRVPCGCSKRTKWKPFQIEIIVGRLCVESGYEYIGFPEGYKNQYSKFEYNCSVHGKQIVSYNDFVNIGNRCPSCYGNKKKTLEEAETISKELCEKEGYEYIGFPEGYKNQNSKFEYNCHIHGKQIVSYNNFVNGRRCPSCAVSGYQPSKPGFLYLYRYIKDGSSILKFGITNRKPDVRSNEHTLGVEGVTSERMFFVKFQDGRIPQKIERYIKKNYETGVCDWLTSGNTETVDVNEEWFKSEVAKITGKILFQ